MKNKNILEKLNDIASEASSKWLEKARQREASRDWIIISSRIAIRILQEIRAQKETNKMSQKALAEKLGVSPQYINKIIKGQENLSLVTICKIEKALGISLIEVPSYETGQLIPLSSARVEKPIV